MSDNNQSNSPSTWLNALGAVAEGGVPQVIAGPAGKAISRLIAGVADIPAAWFEKHAQAIRDQKDARSVIMKEIAGAAARTASSQPEILDRAVDRLLNDLCRKQENREAVARLAVEQLRIDPPPLDTDVPTDDWLSSFERYAENAGSEEFRAIWAKILAGEIRKRGSYSSQTLHVVSMLDPEMANIIEKALKYTINGALINNLAQRVFTFEESFALQDIGFMGMHGQFGSSLNLKMENGIAHVFTEQFVYQVKASGNASVACYVLTKVGREIAATLQVAHDPVEIARSFWSASPAPIEVQFAKVVSRTGENVQIGPWQNSPRPAAGA